METLEQDRMRAELAIRAANAARAFYKFFKEERPDLNSQSNETMIRAHHDGAPITVESIRESVRFLEQNHPDVLHHKGTKQIMNDAELQRSKEQHDAELAKQKAQADDAKERVSLWNQINSLLKVSDGMREGERKKYELKDQKGHFIHPTSAMRERLQMLQATSVFRGTSADQLREHLRSQRPEQVEFPPLPEEYSAQRIRLMPAESLRRLINRYSSAAVTKRLQDAAREE